MTIRLTQNQAACLRILHERAVRLDTEWMPWYNVGFHKTTWKSLHKRGLVESRLGHGLNQLVSKYRITDKGLAAIGETACHCYRHQGHGSISEHGS